MRAAAERLDEHARALEFLADYVRQLAEDDERLLQLGTLAVRGGEFVPGPATEHALSHFTGASVDDCATFLSQLSRTARDDAAQLGTSAAAALAPSVLGQAPTPPFWRL